MIPQGSGYLLLGGDGGIFNFGVSAFHGSLGGQGYDDVTAVAVKSDRSGYVIVRESADVYPFGLSANLGEAAIGRHLDDCRPELEGFSNATIVVDSLLSKAVTDVIGPCIGRSSSYEGLCVTDRPAGANNYCSVPGVQASSGDPGVQRRARLLPADRRRGRPRRPRGARRRLRLRHPVPQHAPSHLLPLAKFLVCSVSAADPLPWHYKAGKLAEAGLQGG